jgi:hypothetical protein
VTPPKAAATTATATVDAYPSRPTAPLRRPQIMLLAVFTIVVEALGILDLLPTVRIGDLAVPLSTLPAFALAMACGARLLGRSSHRLIAIGYWALIAGALPALYLVYLRQDRPGLWLGVVVAAFAEEFVYRLAIPMVLASALRMFGVRATWARPAAFAFAAVWFVLLPGHREQMDHVASATPFLAYAALAALVVYRSGSVIPMGAAHAVTNLLTGLLWSGATSANQRSVSLIVILVALVLAYGRPRRLTVTDAGELLDTSTGLDVVALDLRDGTPPTATLSDGSVIVVEGAGRAEARAVGLRAPGASDVDGAPSADAA